MHHVPNTEFNNGKDQTLLERIQEYARECQDKWLDALEATEDENNPAKKAMDMSEQYHAIYQEYVTAVYFALQRFDRIFHAQKIACTAQPKDGKSSDFSKKGIDEPAQEEFKNARDTLHNIGHDQTLRSSEIRNYNMLRSLAREYLAINPGGADAAPDSALHAAACDIRDNDMRWREKEPEEVTKTYRQLQYRLQVTS